MRISKYIVMAYYILVCSLLAFGSQKPLGVEKTLEGLSNELNLYWESPISSRVFQETHLPEVFAVITSSDSSERALKLNVRINCINENEADTVQQKEYTLIVRPNEKNRVNVADFRYDKFGVYEAEVCLTENKRVLIEKKVRWAYLPYLPKGQKWQRLGVNVHVIRDHLIGELAGLGVDWCRVDWQWALLCPSGIDQIQWDALEQQVNLARKNDIKLLACLNTSSVPEWARDSSKPSPYFDSKKFEEFAFKILDKYAQDVAAVQLYNEPDWGIAECFGRKNIQVSKDEDQKWRRFLSTWIKRISAKLRARYPGIYIVGPGFPASPSSAGGWGKLLEPPYSIGRSLDAFSWHNYPAPRSARPDSGTGSVLGMEKFLNWARPKVAGKTIWITEQGYNTVNNNTVPFNDAKKWGPLWPMGVSEEQQGNYLVRLFLLEWEEGLNRAFLFHLAWDPVGKNISNIGEFYGLFSHNLNGPKLAYAQLAAMGYFLMNAEFVSRVDFQKPYFYALKFHRADKNILVCWNAKGRMRISLPLQWQSAMVFDGFGNKLSQAAGPELVINEQPIYLVRRVLTLKTSKNSLSRHVGDDAFTASNG